MSVQNAAIAPDTRMRRDYTDLSVAQLNGSKLK